MVNVTFQITRLMMLFAVLCVGSSVFAQVDGGKPSQDTLYIIEEEVLYDTLYLYDTLPQPALMSKEELLEAMRRDRGVGRIYYQKGAMYLNGEEELYRLDKADLEGLFSAPEYQEYRKAKRNQYISIPLYALAGGSAAIAGIGLYQFSASFVQTAKYHEQLLDSEDLGLNIWRSAMGGMFLFAGCAVVTTAFIVPAIVLSVKGKATINTLVDDFNASPTTTEMQLHIGASPSGIGLTLSF